MMANDLSDDYVASILAKDAKDSFEKYPFVGTDALLPSRPPVNHPKPNTRFLRTIIRETDNHNAALLAKEAADSKARLDGLVSKDQRSASDIRRRQLGHITAHLTGSSGKRGRTERSSDQSKRRNTSSDDDERSTKSKSFDKRREIRNEDKKERDRESSHRSRKRSRSRSKERVNRTVAHSSRTRSRSPRDGHEKESRHRHRTSHREYREEKGDRERKRRRRSRSPKIENRKLKEFTTKDSISDAKPSVDEDSDPLDEIIGPRPPPKIRSRGRGTTSTESGIDSRFSSTYDPSIDVQIDPDAEKDWDEALEAFRDRQKWKQQGADRLRAAGFTEDQVSKWEKGDEKREEDVQWVKKGESREWDKGKVATGFDGATFLTENSTLDLEFGRLKGT